MLSNSRFYQFNNHVAQVVHLLRVQGNIDQEDSGRVLQVRIRGVEGPRGGDFKCLQKCWHLGRRKAFPLTDAAGS